MQYRMLVAKVTLINIVITKARVRVEGKARRILQVKAIALFTCQTTVFSPKNRELPMTTISNIIILS